MTTTLTHAGLTALFAEPPPARVFAVWRRVADQWVRVGVTASRAAADALAARCATFTIVLPVGADLAGAIEGQR